MGWVWNSKIDGTRTATRNRGSSRIWVGSTFLGLLLLGMTSPVLAFPESFKGWSESEVSGITFLSQASAPRTRELIRSLVEFRQALRVLAPGAVHEAPVPTQVIVFKNEAAYRPYKRIRGADTDHLVGHFSATTFGDWIVINGDAEGGDPLRVVFHEATHAFIAHNFPNVPLWLNEGLAEYYSSFVVAGGRVEIGSVRENHVKILETEGLLSVRTLFDVDTSSSEYRESDRSGRFYAQSWLLAHYLLSAAPENQKAIGHFLAALAQGTGSEQAFKVAFDLDYQEIDRRLKGYLEGSSFDSWSVPLAKQGKEQVILARVRPAWAKYRLGTFLALTRWRSPAQAEQRLAAATSAGVPDAWATRGYLRHLSGQAKQAELFFERALEDGAREALSYTLYGRYLVADSRSGSERALRARQVLEQAVALDPTFVEPRALLGSSYLYASPEFADEGIRHLEEAWSRLPGRPDIPFNLAMLLLRSGDFESAERLVEEVVVPSDRDMGRRAREAVEDARSAQAALRQVERFNSAVELANRGEFGSAQRLLWELQSEDLTRDLEQAVSKALHQLKKVL